MNSRLKKAHLNGTSLSPVFNNTMKLLPRQIDKEQNLTFNYLLEVHKDDFKIARGLAPDGLEQVDFCIKYEGAEIHLTEDEFFEMLKETVLRSVNSSKHLDAP